MTPSTITDNVYSSITWLPYYSFINEQHIVTLNISNMWNITKQVR